MVWLVVVYNRSNSWMFTISTKQINWMGLTMEADLKKLAEAQKELAEIEEIRLTKLIDG